MIVFLRVIWFVIVTFGSVLTFYIGKFIYYMWLSKKLSKATVPFEAEIGTMCMVVVGDSSAIGVGAMNSSESLPGLLHTQYRDIQVINRAKIGSYIQELRKQLSEEDDTCDILLCATGGLDVLFLQPAEKIGKDLELFLELATRKSQKVLFITPLNLGLSTAFPFFLRTFFSRRSEKIGAVIADAVQNFEQVTLINNLLLQAEDVPDWGTICAYDKIHPNAAGYRWVFERLQREFSLNNPVA